MRGEFKALNGNIQVVATSWQRLQHLIAIELAVGQQANQFKHIGEAPSLRTADLPHGSAGKRPGSCRGIGGGRFSRANRIALPNPLCSASRSTAYTSRFRTSSAFSSMNLRRLSTSSPISVEKISFGLGDVLQIHLEQRARFGVHGGFPELLGVHLAQTLVALDGDLARAFAFTCSSRSRQLGSISDLLSRVTVNGGWLYLAICGRWRAGAGTRAR